MKNIIIGTAGHVDHGKTQLIKALSGIDTDRLAEEKKRGITIELGFAHIPNDQGYNIGVIDVPGHEKFIKNMLAGIGGIDFVLFVVAADEGIMPQTKEHFEILQALGIDDGIIAITKRDMVDDEWMGLLLEEVKEYFKGSFLEGKPMIEVSSKTGENLEKLKEEIIKKCDRQSKRKESEELFRLPVDRVFTVQGAGTVVTGTLLDGSCTVNDEVEIFPSGEKAKIRGIQTYGKDVTTAVSGQRTAINLSGIKKEEVLRGNVLGREHSVTVTNMIDVTVRVFSSSNKTVLNNSRVHLYTGSTEVLCKVILLDRDSLTAGKEAYAQLRLEEPIAIRRGDRFIIRFYSPLITVGGGRIIDVCPEKHKRNRGDVLKSVEVMDKGSNADCLVAKANGRIIYTPLEIAYEFGILPKEVEQIAADEQKNGRIVEIGEGGIVSKEKFDTFGDSFKEMIENYHEANPLAAGMPKQEALSRAKSIWHIDNEKKITRVMTTLQKYGIIEVEGNTISIIGFKAEFTDEQKELMKQIEKLYNDAGIEMLKNQDIYGLGNDTNTVVAIQNELSSLGKIVKVNPSYFVSQEGWKRAVLAARSLGKSDEGFTLAEYRDKLNTSRKYASIFLEAFDRAGITAFKGDKRTYMA